MQIRHPRRPLEQTEAERADLALLAAELTAQGRTVHLSPPSSATRWLRVENTRPCGRTGRHPAMVSVCRRIQWEELVANDFRATPPPSGSRDPGASSAS